MVGVTTPWVATWSRWPGWATLGLSASASVRPKAPSSWAAGATADNTIIAQRHAPAAKPVRRRMTWLLSRCASEVPDLLSPAAPKLIIRRQNRQQKYANALRIL